MNKNPIFIAHIELTKLYIPTSFGCKTRPPVHMSNEFVNIWFLALILLFLLLKPLQPNQ
jgi:hypothetical protein